MKREIDWLSWLTGFCKSPNPCATAVISLAISVMVWELLRSGKLPAIELALPENSGCSSVNLSRVAQRPSSSFNSLNSATWLSRRFRRTTNSANMSIKRSNFAARIRIDESSLAPKLEKSWGRPGRLPAVSVEVPVSTASPSLVNLAISLRTRSHRCKHRLGVDFGTFLSEKLIQR